MKKKVPAVQVAKPLSVCRVWEVLPRPLVYFFIPLKEECKQSNESGLLEVNRIELIGVYLADLGVLGLSVSECQGYQRFQMNPPTMNIKIRIGRRRGESVEGRGEGGSAGVGDGTGERWRGEEGEIP